MISVVIPTYNRAHLVSRAVESALNQSVAPAEIIVVDDGSQDDTRVQLARYADQVNYIYQDNAGPAVARNTGIKLAASDWVALLDSDDTWHPQHLERMAATIAATEGRANYYFSDTVEPEDKGGGMLWRKLQFSVDGEYSFVPDGTQWVLMKPQQPMMLQSTVINRALFLVAGGFIPELRLREDTHMFMKLGLGQPICAVNGCGAIMTSDDLADNRLTLTYAGTAFGPKTHAIMFRDLLDSSLPIKPETRAVLKSRLGSAHRNMARHALKKGDYRSAILELINSAWIDPRGSQKRLFRGRNRSL